MAATTPVQPGAVNSAGDRKATFLKLFAGEVLTAFDQTNVMASRHIVRTISQGKSAQFPATGRFEASYHTPGAELAGQAVNANEVVLTIDDLLVADVFIANIDEAMAHWDFRAEYTRQAGQALARKFDKNLLQVAVLAARKAANVSGGSGGTQLTVANARTVADDLVGAIFDSGTALDEKDVPADNRYAFVKPAQYSLLVESSSRAIHRDYGGEGSVASGEVIRINGISIVKTNNLPSTNVITGPTAYQGDFTNTAAVIMHRSAIGTVKLLDLAVESDYLIRNQGTMVVAKYALGHGVLRPESAVEVKVL